MTETPSDPEHGDDDDESAEDQQEGTADAARRGLFDPPDDSEYDTSVKWCKGLRNLPDAFSGPYVTLTRRLLQAPGGAFAVRFSGGDQRTGGFDPMLFTQLVLRAARLNRWVGNAAFQGKIWLPGVAAALPGSLIAHFTRSPEESAQRMAEEQTFPSVAGARAVARLLAVGDEEELLLEAVSPLGKRAVNTYLGTLSDAVESGLAIDWLTKEGQYSHITTKQAEKAIVTLGAVPQMVERRESFVGKLDRPFEEKGTVRVQPIHGRAMTLAYNPQHRERIRGAWGKYVSGVMVIREAENPSLPNAPRRKRRLRSIRHVYGVELDSVPARER